MQPYQEAAQATRRSGEIPFNAVKYGATFALGAGASRAATSIINKVLPLLNSFVPEAFAKKGLSKIDARLGAFLDKAESEGFSFGETKSFLEDKINQTMGEQNAQEEKNIVQKYSPELDQFMRESIQAGEDPIRTAAMAIFDKKKNFESIIRKMEKDHKTPWTAIVESVYGGQGGKNTPNQQQKPNAQPPQGDGKWDKMANLMNDILNS